MNIIIRRAAASDAAELFKLNEKFNGKSDITLEQIASSLVNNAQELVFAAEKDKKLIGFCCVQIFKSFCYSVDYAEITELYIDEENRRTGAGTMLLDHIEKQLECININNLQLFTGGENYSAQAFYEKNGYKKAAEIMYRKRG